jgi:site-specific DNA recombinase
MRAAIYARYSSDLQREASIDDQVRLCRDHIEKEAGVIVEIYTDSAISGGSLHNRPGVQSLLKAANSGSYDAVVAEALDRLSRDQEDIAAIFKRLRHSDVRLITLSEGEISELHVGLKGTMNALFLKDLADKTRRGLEGRVRQGRSGGGNAYGYGVVRANLPDGEPDRGRRVINSNEAAIVVRIFKDFIGGLSPTAIAKKLNLAGVPGPRGAAWRDTTIRGHRSRGTGILNNELYIGRLVWNRMRYVKDPRTGKRVSRANPPDKLVIEDVPQLRIVPDALWQAAKERQEEIASEERVKKVRATRFWERRRPKHFLTGKVICGECKTPLAAVGRDYLGCNRARRQGTCPNLRAIRRDIVEAEVLRLLQVKLMEPLHVKSFIVAYNQELSNLTRANQLDRERKAQEAAAVTRKLEGLYDAIADGLRTPGLQARLAELEARRSDLQAQLDDTRPMAPVHLHPNLAELYRAKVNSLRESLTDPQIRDEATMLIQELVDEVVVTPCGPSRNDGWTFDLTGRIVQMIALGNTAKNGLDDAVLNEKTASSVKVVAGVGFEPTTFRL